jgi:hypothetical protein
MPALDRSPPSADVFAMLASHDDPIASLWSRISELAPREQLDLYSRLGERLGERRAKLSSAEKRAADRARALASLRRACELLGLDLHKGLTRSRYDEVASQHDLIHGSSIVRAFDSWETARDVLAGGRIALSARGKAARSHAPRSPSRAERLEMLNDFLATNPVSTTIPAYTDWANEQNASGKTPKHYLSAPSLQGPSGGLRWWELIALARGNEPKAQSDVSYPTLISARMVGRLTDASRTIVFRKDFPPPVAFSGRAKFWWRDDVLAYRDGETSPAREPYELQDKLCFTNEVADLLSMPRVTLRQAAKAEQWRRGKIPEPLAVVPGVQTAWWREDVEGWLSRQSPKRPRRARARVL